MTATLNIDPLIAGDSQKIFVVVKDSSGRPVNIEDCLVEYGVFLALNKMPITRIIYKSSIDDDRPIALSQNTALITISPDDTETDDSTALHGKYYHHCRVTFHDGTAMTAFTGTINIVLGGL